MPLFSRPGAVQSVLLLILGLISTGLVAGAVLLQLHAGEQPCPLCIILRYLYLLIALLAFIAGILPWRGLRVVAAGVILLFGVAGTGISGYLVYLQFNPLVSCGRDLVQEWTDASPLAGWWPTLFQATGLCGTSYPPVLGLTTPQWSLLSFALIVLGVAAGLVWRRRL